MILSYYLPNTLVWLVVFFSLCFIGFSKALQILLKQFSFLASRSIRHQVTRSMWQISFFSASSFFLYLYQLNILRQEFHTVSKSGFNALGSVEDEFIFNKSSECKPQHAFYTLIIQAFHIHSLLLELLDSLYMNAMQEATFVSLLIFLNANGYRNYFVSFNLLLGTYNVAHEVLSILVLNNPKQTVAACRIYAFLHILVWTHIYIRILPFEYLLPTLAYNYIVSLNTSLLFWYIISVWNSPFLRYGYHYLYHNCTSAMEQECLGQGLAARCVLLQDSKEYRHLHFLQESYNLVKTAQAKLYLNPNDLSKAGHIHSKALLKRQSLQTLRCIMLLKRKAKRFREMKERLNMEKELSEKQTQEIIQTIVQEDEENIQIERTLFSEQTIEQMEPLLTEPCDKDSCNRLEADTNRTYNTLVDSNSNRGNNDEVELSLTESCDKESIRSKESSGGDSLKR